MIRKLFKKSKSQQGAILLPLVVIFAGLIGIFAGTVLVQRPPEKTQTQAYESNPNIDITDFTCHSNIPNSGGKLWECTISVEYDNPNDTSDKIRYIRLDHKEDATPCTAPGTPAGCEEYIGSGQHVEYIGTGVSSYSFTKNLTFDPPGYEDGDHGHFEIYMITTGNGTKRCSTSPFIVGESETVTGGSDCQAPPPTPTITPTISPSPTVTPQPWIRLTLTPTPSPSPTGEAEPTSCPENPLSSNPIVPCENPDLANTITPAVLINNASSWPDHPSLKVQWHWANNIIPEGITGYRVIVYAIKEQTAEEPQEIKIWQGWPTNFIQEDNKTATEKIANLSRKIDNQDVFNDLKITHVSAKVLPIYKEAEDCTFCTALSAESSRISIPESTISPTVTTVVATPTSRPTTSPDSCKEYGSDWECHSQSDYLCYGELKSAPQERCLKNSQSYKFCCHPDKKSYVKGNLTVENPNLWQEHKIFYGLHDPDSSNQFIMINNPSGGSYTIPNLINSQFYSLFVKSYHQEFGWLTTTSPRYLKMPDLGGTILSDTNFVVNNPTQITPAPVTPIPGDENPSITGISGKILVTHQTIPYSRIMVYFFSTDQNPRKKISEIPISSIAQQGNIHTYDFKATKEEHNIFDGSTYAIKIVVFNKAGYEVGASEDFLITAPLENLNLQIELKNYDAPNLTGIGRYFIYFVDLIKDGFVNSLDYDLVVGNYGPQCSKPQDVNGDGVCNGVDLSSVIYFIGQNIDDFITNTASSQVFNLPQNP